MQTETRQPLQVFCEQLNGKRDQLFSLSVFAKTIVQEMLQVSSLYVSDSSQVEFGQFAAGMFDEKSILPELKAKLQRPFDAETSHSTNSHLPQGASFTDIPKEHSNPNQRGQLVIVPDQNDLRVATSSVLQKTEQRFEEFLEVLSSLDDLTPEELDFNDEFTKESLTRAYLTVCAIKKLCPKIAPPVIKNSKFANNFKLEFPEIAADCEQQVQQISSEGLPDQEEFLTSLNVPLAIGAGNALTVVTPSAGSNRRQKKIDSKKTAEDLKKDSDNVGTHKSHSQGTKKQLAIKWRRKKAGVMFTGVRPDLYPIAVSALEKLSSCADYSIQIDTLATEFGHLYAFVVGCMTVAEEGRTLREACEKLLSVGISKLGKDPIMGKKIEEVKKELSKRRCQRSTFLLLAVIVSASIQEYSETLTSLE